MLNNKGLVVSTVLYSLLISFLLFLGITLANFASTNKIVSNGSKDLINGISINAKQIYEIYDENSFDSSVLNKNASCGYDADYAWYQMLEKNDVGYVVDADGNGKIDVKTSNLIVRINTRYGTLYWPRDFDINNNDIELVINDNTTIKSGNLSFNNKIGVSFANLTSDYSKDDYNIPSLSGYGSVHYGALIFEDTVTGEKSHAIIVDVCKSTE